MIPSRWEHFDHASDIGVRGIGPTREEAFAQAAIALTAVITEPSRVTPAQPVEIEVEGPDDALLLLAWLDALIYEMATRRMLFSKFSLRATDHRLAAIAWGEPVSVARHRPAVEVKAATFSELKAEPTADGDWLAQCVVDV
jgi:tRNA nucleotidyltransferase (CCA-adding enzyme)